MLLTDIAGSAEMDMARRFERFIGEGISTVPFRVGGDILWVGESAMTRLETEQWYLYTDGGQVNWQVINHTWGE
jgi:hypothetical protein